MISIYFLAMPADGWSDGFTNTMKLGVVGFVWTGIIRWNLPRIRRWNKQRSTA